MRYTGPKNRISRREGVDLGLKTFGTKAQAKLVRKLNIAPGQHGVKGKKKSSDYARQIREKQKLKALFGITDKQLKNYFLKASTQKGNTAVYLIKLLEGRLDNVVYRLGFAPTRAAARQLVSHGHIALNGRRNTIASTNVLVGATVSFAKASTKDIPYIAAHLDNKDVVLPSWLEKKGTTGTILAEPTGDDVDKLINTRLVVEFYSR